MTGQRDNGTFFTVTWENDIREFFSTYRRQSAPRAWCWGSCSSKHCECISRLYQHIIFFFLFVMSYLWTMAPGLLAVLDTAVTSTLYYLFAPEAQEPRAPTWEFRFQKSLLDVVGPPPQHAMGGPHNTPIAYQAANDPTSQHWLQYFLRSGVPAPPPRGKSSPAPVP
mmetsp:Transcript_6822/g.23840  ORF Transcript_6822/g.23840 Transcript_6822/m.23840 type:complete len:167 (-) Transcript_6822:345-845(-)